MTSLGADIDQLRGHGEAGRSGSGRIDEGIERALGAISSSVWKVPDVEAVGEVETSLSSDVTPDRSGRGPVHTCLGKSQSRRNLAA